MSNHSTRPTDSTACEGSLCVRDALDPEFAAARPHLEAALQRLRIASDTTRTTLLPAGTVCIVAGTIEKVGTSEYFKEQRELHGTRESCIALPFSAYGAVDPGTVSALNSYDNVWVTSRRQRDIFAQSGVRAELLHVQPIGVTAIPAARQRPVADAPFCFLSIPDWLEHEGLDILLRSYIRSFAGDHRVKLLLAITGEVEAARAEVREVVESMGAIGDRAPAIEVTRYHGTLEERQQLYANADCYAAPYRCDAVGTRLLEAAAAGLAVITPRRNSIHEMFTEEEMYFLDTLPEQPARETSLAGQLLLCETSCYAEPSEEALGAILSAARNAPAENERRGYRAARRVLSMYTACDTALWIQGRCMQAEGTARPRVRPAAAGSPHIGFDMRSLGWPEISERGIGHYAINHLMALAQLLPDYRFTAYTDTPEPVAALAPLAARKNITIRCFDQIHHDIPDLQHIPDPVSMLPHYDSPFRVAPAGCPLSVLFHDMIPVVLRQLHLDHWRPGTQAAYFRRLELMKEREALVLTNSEHTRRDVHQFTNIPLDRIVAVMAGLNHRVDTNAPAPGEIAAVLQKFAVQQPFFMSVGAFDGHKDPIAMLEGFLAVQQGFPALQLAVTGSMLDPYKVDYKRRIEEAGVRGIVFTGYLAAQELRCLYAAACGLVFPSLYEGFGFPVLEAMAHGCPVITTNVSSLPEVAGSAGVLVPPHDAGAIAAAMQRLAQDKSYRAERAAAGLEQAAKFSWEKTAQRTYQAWIRRFGLPASAAADAAGAA